MSQAWKNANIILLHKRGDGKEVQNYRPIILHSVTYKLFTKVLFNRISAILYFQQPKEQAGFRKGFSTMDHIHTIKQIIEKCLYYNKSLNIAFIDYEKEFDSEPTSAVIKALRDHGVETPHIALFQDICDGCTGTILLHQTTNKFPVRKGVREGDTISTKLFTACLEGVFRKLIWGKQGYEYMGNT